MVWKRVCDHLHPHCIHAVRAKQMCLCCHCSPVKWHCKDSDSGAACGMGAEDRALLTASMYGMLI